MMSRKEYKIGRISELTGLTSEALRYYEHEGIVSPKKSSTSGYRMYSAWDLHILIRTRAYRRYGFTLAEIVRALDQMDASEITELLHDKEIELKHSIEEQLLLLEQMQHDRLAIIDANTNIGKYRIENSPALHLIETQESYDIMDSKLDLYRTWINMVPFASSGGIFEAINGNKLRYGLIVEDDSICDPRDALFIDSISIPAKKCLTTFFRSGSEKELCIDMFKPAFEFMENKGLKLTGDPFARAVLMTRDDRGEYHSLYQGWVPFEGDCEYCSPPPPPKTKGSATAPSCIDPNAIRFPKTEDHIG